MCRYASRRKGVKLTSVTPLTDISELNLAKTTSIAFPEGKDKLLTFEVTIKPDEGHYKCASARLRRARSLPRWQIDLSLSAVERRLSAAQPSQGGCLPLFLQRADRLPARGPQGQVPLEGVPLSRGHPRGLCSREWILKLLTPTPEPTCIPSAPPLPLRGVACASGHLSSMNADECPPETRGLSSGQLAPATGERRLHPQPLKGAVLSAPRSQRDADRTSTQPVHVLSQVYHPNIDNDGNVCLNILREDWKPVLSVNSIIYGLQYLFLVRRATSRVHSQPLVFGCSGAERG